MAEAGCRAGQCMVAMQVVLGAHVPTAMRVRRGQQPGRPDEQRRHRRHCAVGAPSRGHGHIALSSSRLLLSLRFQKSGSATPRGQASCIIRASARGAQHVIAISFTCPPTTPGRVRPRPDCTTATTASFALESPARLCGVPSVSLVDLVASRQDGAWRRRHGRRLGLLISPPPRALPSST